MVKVAIVILNWNGKKDTMECLKSLRKLNTKDYSLAVIVVDNASTDGSIQDFKKVTGFDDFQVIENNENIGFAAGNNVGIKKALNDSADFIVLLNNDTVVKEDLIDKFLEASEKHKRAGILTPKIYFYPGYEFHKERYTKTEVGRVIWYAGGVIDWDNVYASNYGVDDTDIGQYSKELEYEFATGACMFVKREVFEKAGMFDERYYLYLEDTEFSQRVKHAGWKIIFVPDAVLWHKVSQSSAIGGGLNDYFITRNRLLFGMRFAPSKTKRALLKEAAKLAIRGREWQKRGARDFFMRRFKKGSWK
jgi:GT2 family glycosyltransferase